MFGAMFKAFGQLFSPGFRWVLLKSIGLTIALYVVLGFGLQQLLDAVAVTDLGWLDKAIDIVATLGFVVGLVFLMGPVAALFAGLFLDRIAEQVEQKHYPDDPPGADPPFVASIVTAVGFTVVIIFVNLFVLVISPLLGVNFLVYLAGNGYLLGREYFELVAARFMPRRDVKALRKSCRGRVFVAGALIALLAAIPFVNLLVPLFATAFMVHVFKGVTRARDEQPPRVSLRM